MAVNSALNVRKLVTMPRLLETAVQSYRFSHRINTETEAYRRLIHIGLAAEPILYDLLRHLPGDSDLAPHVTRLRVALGLPEAETADPVAFQQAMTRLAALRALTDGWQDGDGKAIAAGALAAAEEFLHRRPAICGQCRLYPTEAGAILLDFERDGWDCSIEFAADALQFYGIEIAGDLELVPQSFASVDALVAAFDQRIAALG